MKGDLSLESLYPENFVGLIGAAGFKSSSPRYFASQFVEDIGIIKLNWNIKNPSVL